MITLRQLTTRHPQRPGIFDRHLQPAIRAGPQTLQKQAGLQTRDVGPRGRRPEHRRPAAARDTSSRSSCAREPRIARYVHANHPEHLSSPRQPTQPHQVHYFRRSADPISQQRWCSHHAQSSPPQRHSQQRWCHHHAQSTQRSIYHSPKLEAGFNSAAEVPGLSLHHGSHSDQNGEPRPRATASTQGRAVRGPCDSQRGAGGRSQVPQVRGLGPQSSVLSPGGELTDSFRGLAIPVFNLPAGYGLY